MGLCLGKQKGRKKREHGGRDSSSSGVERAEIHTASGGVYRPRLPRLVIIELGAGELIAADGGSECDGLFFRWKIHPRAQTRDCPNTHSG